VVQGFHGGEDSNLGLLGCHSGVVVGHKRLGEPCAVSKFRVKWRWRQQGLPKRCYPTEN